ncbi:hypothetical protein BDQ17DRAFT_1333854 [Cyathus striatus]|nr:hypothetical protein BDQ17DRAFT_1333854 [Cyathus striatus]
MVSILSRIFLGKSKREASGEKVIEKVRAGHKFTDLGWGSLEIEYTKFSQKWQLDRTKLKFSELQNIAIKANNLCDRATEHIETLLACVERTVKERVRNNNATTDSDWNALVTEYTAFSQKWQLDSDNNIEFNFSELQKIAIQANTICDRANVLTLGLAISGR